MAAHQHLYSLIIAVHPEHENPENRNYPENPDVVDGDGHVHVLDNDNDHAADRSVDWRLGEITVDWVDFTREKSVDRPALSLASASMEGTSTLHGHGSGAGSGAGAGAASKPGSGSRRKVVGSAPTPSRPVPGSFTTATSTLASASAGSEHNTSHTSHTSHPSHPHSQSHSHATPTTRKKSKSPSDATSSPDSLSLQPLLAHFPGPNPLESSVASGVTQVGRGVVHLFRHAPPPALISSLEAHPLGESSAARRTSEPDPWSGERAEGEDGSLIAILAVPAWMRPADFLEFIGGWSTGLEGVRMIREATTPNRSIVLLKFRDPLQASDFLVIFTGRAFSTLDARETCHPIRIHHLVLHKTDTGADTGTGAPSHVVPSSLSRTRSASRSVNSGTGGTSGTVSIPAFPPSVYASRAAALPELLHGVPPNSRYELPSCPVCLERLDSTVTGLVTLPCAHTFDCDCLRKWGDSRCPVCRVSHLLLSTTAGQVPNAQSKGQVQAQAQAQGATGASALGQAGPREGVDGREEILRLTQCSMCDSTESNWICVVCGVVGCGRYEPGKGHARRHWEESGHVLAMELETQRVWDYKGDNYVHRLIQTRNDGKLVELPSASSLVTPISRPLPLSSRLPPNTPSPSSGRPCESESMPSSNARSASRHHSPSPLADAGRHRSSNGDVHGYAGGDRGGGADTPTEAGPSSNDIDKMSTIEAITLEYSYLLSSQLEAMRQHYESQTASSLSKLQSLESAESRAAAAESAREEAERARQKAEKKADKATELTRALQANLSAEKAMAQGLTARITKLREELEKRERETKDKDQEVKQLEETVRDLMFSLEAGATIKAAGGEDAGQGGDLVVVPGDDKKKKKGRK